MSHETAKAPTEIYAVRIWGVWKTFVNRDALTAFLERYPDVEVQRATLRFESVDTAEFRRPVRVYRVNLRYKVGRETVSGPAFDVCTAVPSELATLALEAAASGYPQVASSCWNVSSHRVIADATPWGPEGTSRQVREFTPPAG
ncbi:hypothetical protein ACFRMQ_00150 [Kitasatospora sp. NPDC056783]|uniref:hypothetical protein n=1 Tax=Kitasatospora sp. NPDC056783 TaxID=3345943 RepID=UPI0036CB1CFD